MQPTLPSHLTQNWGVTKPAAYGRKGLVVAQAKTAAEAGVAILDAGGNAVDAAVATALALAAVEPWNSGLGGIGFALVHRAGEHRAGEHRAGQRAAEVVDFGPVAPAALDPDRFRLTGRTKHDLFPWPEVEGDVNVHGPLSFAIPSAPSGYRHMHMSWGRLPFADVIAPAIALARRGLPQDWLTTLKIANAAAVLRRYSESTRIYLPDGLPPVPPYQGTPGFMPLGRLADTLEQLQRAGLDDFYRGEVAASIAADLRDLGAALSAEDLATCEARVMPAMEVPWRGRVLQLSGGLTAAPTLARVVRAMERVVYPGAPDAAWFQALARAMRQAYAERLAALGDNEPRAAETCTTHLSAIDAEGTMVSLTSTLLSSMGSRVVLPRSGVLMNNGVMWFDPRPGQANSIGPRRRPLTNMLPVILKDGHRPVIAAGASGGRRIMAAVFQLLTFVADFGMDLETAAHHPRIDVSSPDGTSADQRLAPDIIAALAEDGPVQAVEHATLPINFACPNLIIQHDDGSRAGISDALSPWSAAVAQN
jgi:gamma-glutamyltranspeptidase / glutathione hydrolase